MFAKQKKEKLLVNYYLGRRAYCLFVKRGLGFVVQGLGCKAYCLFDKGFRVWVLRFRAYGLGFRF